MRTQCREVVVPPFRFGSVEADVFRSAQPTLKNYRFISRLKPRTVVAIAPEAPVRDEAMFCRRQGAQLVPIRAEMYRDEAVTLTSPQVAQILSILVDPDRLPALVHCPDGRVLTGVVLWCMRKLQCWDNRASLEEFKRYCGGVPPTREVEKFVDSFNDEVTIPGRVPRWLWAGDRAQRHPGIRLRHQPPLEISEAELQAPLQSLRRSPAIMDKGLPHPEADLNYSTEDLVGEHGDSLSPPKLSRVVQALSLEGLEMIRPLGLGSYDEEEDSGGGPAAHSGV